MKKELNVLDIYNTGDPAGFIPESELVKLSDSDDAAGVAAATITTITTSSWVCGATVAISIATCPTFKCTSKCGT